MKPKEYLFIDRHRLQSYYEQISSPEKLLKTYKIPTWTVAMSATGPEVSAENSHVTREHTVYEKIQIVQDYLNKEDLLSNADDTLDFENWPSIRMPRPFFVLTRIKAQRVIFTPSKNPLLDGLHFAIWIGQDEYPGRGTHNIYFIEACPDSDDLYYLHIESGFTLLEFILNRIEQDNVELRRTLLGDRYMSAKKRAPHEGEDFVQEDLVQKFTRNPLEYFEKMGGKVGPPKNIDCLYRIRCLVEKPLLGIIGYPLYVCESESTETTTNLGFNHSHVSLSVKEIYRMPFVCSNCGDLTRLPLSEIKISDEVINYYKDFPLCDKCGHILWGYFRKQESFVMLVNFITGLGVLGTLIVSNLIFTNSLESLVFIMLMIGLAAWLRIRILKKNNRLLITDSVTKILNSVTRYKSRDTMNFEFSNSRFADLFTKANLKDLHN